MVSWPQSTGFVVGGRQSRGKSAVSRSYFTGFSVRGGQSRGPTAVLIHWFQRWGRSVKGSNRDLLLLHIS